MPVGIDTSVLSHDEVIEYNRLLLATSDRVSLPAGTARRLRTAKWLYTAIWVTSILVAAVIGYSMYGMTFSMGAAMYIAFTMGCLFAVAYSIQVAFAEDRAKKERKRQPDLYLESIGYAERLKRRQLRQNASTSNEYDAPSWWVAGYDHSRHRGMFSSSDRTYMNAHGMDADTYISNVLENDKD